MKIGVVVVTLLVFVTFPPLGSSGRAVTRRRHHVWGEWAPWTACTRSCGTGIMTRTRDCLNSKHKPVRKRIAQCIGSKTEAKVCNRKACPKGAPDEYSRQCAKFDGQLLAGKAYTWVPFHRVGEECVLNCRAVGHRFYARLKPKLEDGTPCGRDKVCFAGRCLGFGCDEIIREGEYCALSRGLFNNRFLPNGYNRITTIPASACNMTFLQMRHTLNNFAIRTIEGRYIFNGITFKEDVLHTIPTDFGIFTYMRNSDGERLANPGPIKQPLELMLYTRQENLGITYEYYHSENVDPLRNQKGPAYQIEHLQDSKHHLRHQHHYYLASSNINYAHERPDEIEKTPKKTSRYDWVKTGYSECTKTCAGGVQEAIFVCKRLDRDMIVPDKRCSGSQKPESHVRQCNVRPCIPEWSVLEWGPCSATCGDGVQTREVQCKQQINPQSNIVVTSSACSYAEIPRSSQNCHLKPCEASWIAGQWSECSSSCGPGVKTRNVRCNASYCLPKDKPEDNASCEGKQCSFGNQSSVWVFTDWSNECSGYCGEGHEERRVICHGVAECDKYSEPARFRKCEAQQNFCAGQWFTGPWSECLGKCDWGERKRGVACVKIQQGAMSVVPEESCSTTEKPIIREYCQLPPCPTEWFSSEWSECTQGCNGLQERLVVCLDEKNHESAKCYSGPKPENSRPCEDETCNQLQPGNVTLSLNRYGCNDKLKNCRIAAQARMCAYDFYAVNCCYSCSRKKRYSP